MPSETYIKKNPPAAADAANRPSADASIEGRAPRGGVPVPAGIRALGNYLGALGRRLPMFSGDPDATPVQRLEAQLLHRLDEGLQRAREAASTGGGPQRVAIGPTHEPPTRVLAQLLEASERQTPDSAREYLYTALLRQLVPDQVRMLAALANGQAHSVLHVHAGSRLGSAEQPVTRFISALGATAGVQLPGMAAYYLSHLVALGLVDEDDACGARGERAALLASATAMAGMQAIRDQGMRPRLHDASVAISQLGGELWAACGPQADDTAA